MPLAANASFFDLATELSLTQELAKTLAEEQVVWLPMGNNRSILALFERTDRKDSKGGVILLPNLGKNLDWPFVFKPLREELAAHGWSTLSVQPVITYEPMGDITFDDEVYAEMTTRLDKAMAELSRRNIKPVAIVAEGLSANLAAAYLADDPGDLNALVCIDIDHQPYANNWRNSLKQLEKIAISVLDVYATPGNLNETHFAAMRLKAARRSAQLQETPYPLPYSAKVRELALNKDDNQRFRQHKLMGAFRDNSDSQTRLIRLVRGWLNRFGQTTEPD